MVPLPATQKDQYNFETVVLFVIIFIVNSIINSRIGNIIIIMTMMLSFLICILTAFNFSISSSFFLRRSHNNFCINIAAHMEGGIPDFSLQFKRLEDLLLKEIGGIKTEVAGIKSDVAGIKTKIFSIEDKYGPNWIRASETYEIMARGRIKRMFPEAKAIKCQTLKQLAEISLPQNFNFAENKRFSSSQSLGETSVLAISTRVDTLAFLAQQQVPKLQEWYNDAMLRIPKTKDKTERDQLKRKTGLLGFQLAEYNELQTDSLRRSFLSNRRLGFYAYSTLTLMHPGVKGFVEELEMDYFLPSTVNQRKIVHRFGEVKFGKESRSDAICQCCVRIGFLYTAAKHAMGRLQIQKGEDGIDRTIYVDDKLYDNYTFEGDCRVNSPFDWEPPALQEIVKIQESAGMLEYPAYTAIIMEKHIGIED